MRSLLRVVPTLVCLGLALPAGSQILPADRLTTWNPGVVGGIPARSTVCATVNAATCGNNGASEASGCIQVAIDACPVGQVVQLSAGVFTLNASYVRIGKGITLRGAGAGLTTLRRTIGAVPGSDVPGVSPKPLVIIGPSRYPHPDETTARNLTADAVKGATSVTVSSATGFAAGQFVILDEDNYLTGSWIALPDRNGAPTSVTIWATDRIVWQKHNPTATEDDPFPGALTWFSRSGRPVNEIKEIASVSGNTITFTTPIHIDYRVSHTAQVTRWTGSDNVHVKNAGLEDVKVTGGDDGAIRFEAAAYSWVKNVEDTIWLGEGVAINQSFRCELRDSYIHDAARSVPGGGAYAISLADASAENLIENNVILKANKMMVARSAGAGSVVGYNYADDGFIDYDLTWQEVGLNGSHMVGPHHMLFEGNESFNYDSDNTHGSAIYHTVFRNHLMGFRRSFTGLSNARTAGLGYGSWWHSFVGNVQGISGQMAGWIYEDLGNGGGGDPWGGDAIWRLGYDPIHWDQKADTMVQSTTIRDGNFDYVTNTIHWAGSPQSLPNSLYRGSKPPFFAAYTWPWVDPVGGTKLFTLPARARYDAGNPNPFTLLVAKAGTGLGTVTSSSPTGLNCGIDCMVSYNLNTVVNLTATATPGSTFTGWTGACTGTGACSVTMNAFKSVTATFTLNTTQYALTVTKAGTGTGTVTSSPAGINCGATCSANFTEGTIVNLTAAPANGSGFTGWSGACTGTGACQITMDAAKSVTATFTIVYTLTVTRTGTGLGSVTSSPPGIDCGATCSVSFPQATVVTLTPTPTGGSNFVAWGGACTGNGACLVTMSQARTVSATFNLVSCGPETVIVPDGRVIQTTIGAVSTLWFGATVRIGNSYSVEFKNTSGRMLLPGVLTMYSGDDACAGAGTLPTRDNSIIDPIGSFGSVRVGFVATGTNTFVRAKLLNAGATAIPLSVSWSDTTMFTPSWSTNGAFDTYYSFLNTTGTALNGTLTVVNAAGTTVKTLVVLIPAGRTIATNTVSLGIGRNQTGTARFRHDGPPGAVLAEAVVANFSISPAFTQPVKFQAAREGR